MDDELSVERYLTKAVGDFTAGLAGIGRSSSITSLLDSAMGMPSSLA